MDTPYKRLVVLCGKTKNNGLFFINVIVSTNHDGLREEDLRTIKESQKHKILVEEGIEEPNLEVVNVIKLL